MNGWQIFIIVLLTVQFLVHFKKDKTATDVIVTIIATLLWAVPLYMGGFFK